MEKQIKIKVLVIDDEELICKGLSEFLELSGFHTEYALKGEEGLTKIKNKWESGDPFNAVVCDWRMPDISGDEVLERALKIDAYLCFLMLTAFGVVDRAVTAMKNGAYYYFQKPLNTIDNCDEILQMIRKGVIEKEVRKIKAKVLTSLDLNSILDSIVNAVEIIFHPKEYCLAIIGNHDKKLVIKKQKGLCDDLIINENMGFVKWLIEKKAPLLINNIDNPDKINPLREGSKSIIAVPLYVLDNFLGILELESSKEGFFSLFDLSVLTDFGNEASIALFNSNIYEMQHELDTRSFRSIAHQIKQPLTNIELAVEALSINLASKSVDEIKGKLETIKDNTELAENIVKRILLNYKDEKQPIKLAMIFNRIKSLPYYKGNKRILWPHVDSLDIEIDCKPNQIEFVFQNLISNALEAIKEKEEGKLIISLEKDNFIALSFKDNGPGIKDKDKDKIFNQIFTTKAENFGTGLGLFLSKSFIEGHGGSINFETWECVGTTFIVKIPYKSLIN